MKEDRYKAKQEEEEEKVATNSYTELLFGIIFLLLLFSLSLSHFKTTTKMISKICILYL